MAKNTFNSIATLLAATALVTPWGVPAWAQTTEPDAGGPDLQHRCTMVALTSDTPMLPVQLIEPYLQERDDFRSSRLVLTGDANAADASVTLTRNGETTTRIAVANRATGQYVSAISGWTDYPGMVALAIMDQLRQVCPGSIVALPKYRAAPKQCVPAPALCSLSTVSACSLTSWMDNRELYNALRANAELKQASIQLLPACSSADATLEITHNLDRTLEWSWRLVSSQHQTVYSGNVIAFAVGNAAERISDRVAREIALARGDSVEPAGNTRQRAQEDISIRNIRSHLSFSDLSQHDSRISLSVDGERVSGRDASNRV